MITEQSQSDQVDKLALEVENLRRQNEKLVIEIQTLKATSPTSIWEGRFARLVPVLTSLVAVFGLLFGVVQYHRAEQAALEQRKEADQTLRLDLKRETAKPFWATQLQLYIEAAEKAATIATTQDEQARSSAEARFWILYWGPLAAVEDVGLTKSPTAEIEAAMVRFGNCLGSPFNARDPQELRSASLVLAHAIRDALAPAFDIEKADLKDLRIKNQTQ